MADEENPTASQPSEPQPTTPESSEGQPDKDAKPKGMFSRFLSDVFDKSKGPLGLLSNNPTTLKNLILSAVTVGLEILLNKEFFNCPLENYKRYGWAFIFAPVFILFFANVLIIGQVWQLSSRCFIPRYQRRGECFARLIPNIFKALVGPGVWLLATFADTDYYVCATVGPDAVKRNITGDEAKALEKKMDAAQSTSHLWAWLVFVVMVTVCTIVIVAKNCFLKDKVLLENAFDFERREAVQALNTFRWFIRGLPKEKTRVDGDRNTTPPPEEVDAEPTPNEGREDNDDGTRGIADVMVLGSNENVKLWVNGIPELTGEERVKKIFKGWLDKDPKWSYLKAYKAFAKMYPRAASGDPKDPWKTCDDDPLRIPMLHRLCHSCLSRSTSTPGGASRHSSNGSVSIPLATLDDRDHTVDREHHEDASLLA